MNKLDIRKKIDLEITILIGYFFALCMSFVSIDSGNNYIEKYILLTILMIIGIISYYTNVTIALIATLIVDFMFINFKLYANFFNNVQIETSTYYWLILMPVTALIVSILSKDINKLQNELVRLEEENLELVTIDSDTQLKNNKALMNELSIYRNMSIRYKLPVTLIIVKFKFNENLKSLLGEKEYKNLLIEASRVFKSSLREEDGRYLIEKGVFAFITITDTEGAKIIKNRFKENINKLDFFNNSFNKSIKLDIQVGYCISNESINNPMEWLKIADKETEYDVSE